MWSGNSAVLASRPTVISVARSALGGRACRRNYGRLQVTSATYDRPTCIPSLGRPR